MAKLYLIFIPVSLILAFLLLRPIQSSHPHYHAGFRVFVNGELQDFSSYQFMNYSTCQDHTSTLTPAEEQLEKAHLHDGVGDVVHVHRQGAIWADLFHNLGYQVESKNLQAYRQGSPLPDALQQPILPNDSLIFVVGDASQIDFNTSVSLAHIQAIESQSEACSD